MTLGIAFESGRPDGSGGHLFKGFLRRLDGIADHAADATSAFQEIHKQFLATERGLFSSKGGKAKWAPLTADYQRRKARKGLDPRIERATGALAQALTTGRGAGAVTEIGPAVAMFGTDLKRAVYAHRGSGRRRRRLIVMDRKRRDRWTATIRDHLLSTPSGGGAP